MNRRGIFASLALGLAGLAAAPAHADKVYWSIGINTPNVSTTVSNGRHVVAYPPAPVVVYPSAPVVYHPPVVYAPPPRVVYAPRPVYYGHPAPVVVYKHGHPRHRHYDRHGHRHGDGHWRGHRRDRD